MSDPLDAAGAAAAAPTGRLPLGSELESASAYSTGAPDPAWIARIANALFTGLPSNPLPLPGASLPAAPVYVAETLASAGPGLPTSGPSQPSSLTPGVPFVPAPGAGNPSAPLYAFEPLAGSVPGVPTFAPPQPQTMPPGPAAVPSAGAGPPSMPIHAVEPMVATGFPGPAEAGLNEPLGEKGGTTALPASPSLLPFPAANGPQRPNGQAGFVPGSYPGGPELGALPSIVGGSMSAVPNLNDPSAPFGYPGASLPAAPIYAGETLAGSMPGAPTFAPPVSPNATPGAPSGPTGAGSPPSAPVYAFEPLAASAPGIPAAPLPPQPQSAPPGSTAVPSAGYGPPSAPVYAFEPVAGSTPGIPAVAPAPQPQSVPPTSTVVPSAGYGPTSAPVHAAEPLLSADVPTVPQSGFIEPAGEKAGINPLPSPSLTSPGIPQQPSGPSGFGAGSFPGGANLDALPSTLGDGRSAVPHLDDPAAPFGYPGASLPSAPGLVGAPAATSGGRGLPLQDGLSESDLRVLPNTLGDATSLLPRFQDGAAPFSGYLSPETALGGANPRETYYFLDEGLIATSRASPAPHGSNGQGLNFGALPSQHTPELSLPPISGARPFDAHLFRREFPILHEYVNGRPLIWLDNAATTQKPQAVIDRISHFYERENSNVHRAAHALAARSTDAFEAAREKVRRFINAPGDENIIWVRGTTEAVNLVAQAWGRRNVGEGDEVVITNLEHHSNIVPWQMLCAEKGAKLRVAPVDDRGDVLLDEYEKLLNPRTRIVAFTHVSNALGTITPVRDMVAMAHRHGARVLVDGAQAVSHMPVDVQALDADFYVFSGHKVFGPTGVGVLYGKGEELDAMPPWQGGGSMIKDVTFEKSVFQDPPERFEAGTGTIADAVGLGAAIDYLETIGMGNIAAYEHELLAYMLDGLLTVPGLKLVGTPRQRAGAVSFVLDECRVEDVGAALNRDGIAVRAGHHCAQPILRRFGHESTVRPSLALYNTPEDIDALIAALHRIASERGRRGR